MAPPIGGSPALKKSLTPAIPSNGSAGSSMIKGLGQRALGDMVRTEVAARRLGAVGRPVFVFWEEGCGGRCQAALFTYNPATTNMGGGKRWEGGAVAGRGDMLLAW